MSGVTTAEEPRAAQLPTRNGLTIRVSSGEGMGRTRLSAFDAALLAAGVGNFNLLRLSSVIPPGSEVREVGHQQQLVGQHGDRLYCVYAEAYASTPLEQTWAGVAWSLSDDDSGEGLFVEHTGASEATVRHDLHASLADLSARRGGRFHPVGEVVAVAECVDHPVCAVVIATYSHAPWGTTGSTVEREHPHG